MITDRHAESMYKTPAAARANHFDRQALRMAQRIFLILAFCAVAWADIQLTGQPTNCTSERPDDRKELIDFGELRIEQLEGGVRGFRGSIEILLPISSLEVTVYYEEYVKGDLNSIFSPDPRDVCITMDNMSPSNMMDMMSVNDGPESFFIDRILEQSPSMNCDPPIEAQTYDMDDVGVNQAQLKGLNQEAKYVMEIEFESPDGYTCIRLTGDVVPDTM